MEVKLYEVHFMGVELLRYELVFMLTCPKCGRLGYKYMTVIKQNMRNKGLVYWTTYARKNIIKESKCLYCFKSYIDKDK
jgi:hypothetical protein